MATAALETQSDIRIESSDKSSLLLRHRSKGSKLSTAQWIVIIFIVVIITNIASNMDRIIDALQSSDTSNTAQTYSNEYDIVLIGAGITGLLHSYLLSTESDQTYTTLTVERFDRLCGRTHTVNIKHNGSSIHFENGAMRFSYNTLHQQLLKKLDLCDNVIPLMDTSDWRSTKPTANYLYRNHRKKYASINNTNYWQKVFNLHPRVLFILCSHS